MNLRHESCESRFGQTEDKSLDVIVADIPFNASSMAKGEAAITGFKDHAPIRREFGKWDFGYSPLYLIEESHRVLVDGGWLIVKSGDKTFGMVREFGERDGGTLKSYIDFFDHLGIVEFPDGARRVIDRLSTTPIFKMFSYKATVAWHKTNPMTSVRKVMPRSSMEWLQILRRNKDNGSPAQPVAWNFLEQSEMKNCIDGETYFVKGGRCQEPERLYWHSLDGEIVPCHAKKNCTACLDGKERISHPTQTPLYVWRWIYKRYTSPGLRAYDPYAGLGTSGIAAEQMGLEWHGSEVDEDYARVGNMWANGKWDIPSIAPGQPKTMEMF